MSNVIDLFHTDSYFFFISTAAGIAGNWRIDQLLNETPFIKWLKDLGDDIPSTAPGDICSQIFFYSGQVISLLDTTSLNEIYWNQDELLLSQLMW